MLKTLREYRDDYLTEIRGTTVYGPNQEKLGKLEDVIFDDRTGDLRYVVVEAGWLRSRRFILPANQVYASAHGDELYANLRRDDVETLPKFRPECLASDDAFARYEADYRRAWRYDADPRRLRANPQMENLRERVRESLLRDRALRAQERPAIPPATYIATSTPRPTAVYGVYTSRNSLERALERLRDAGFRSDDISVVFPERDMTQQFALEKNTKAPEGALAGGGTGLVIGGALGWLAGIGTLAIPGIGPLIAAGPIVAVIAGAGVGSAIGGIAGALIGLGVPEIEAKRYEEEIKRGRILISVLP